MVDESPEKRRALRPRVIKRGTITLGMHRSEIACTLHNQHADGAELTVATDVHVPDKFLLYVPVDGVAYSGVVCWRRKDRLGVQFTGTEPKPPYHYG